MANTLIEFSNDLANAVERGGKSVVAIKEGGRNGVSGTIWREGIVAASEHTVRGRDEVTLVLPSGKTATATVVGRDPSTDVAALKFEGTAATLPEFGDAAQLRPGNVVLALGRRAESLSASYGIVSATGGGFRTWRGGRIDNWFRLDLSPYPGFSGGPLVDAAGRVLGINTSGPQRGVLTIPRSTVDRVLDQLLAKGRITRGYVGIGGQPVVVPPVFAGKLDLKDNRALLVVMVAEGGPAEKAGVAVGDIILSLAGTPIAEPTDLLAFLEPETVGKSLTLRVLRGGTPTELTIKIGERENE